MKITKAEFTKLLNKIVSSLTTHFKDPKVINYNFYNNTSGVGVKMVRQGKKMTIEDLAAVVTKGFAKMDAFIIKQEVFNQEVRDFMVKQEKFNKNQKKFNKKQEEFNNKQVEFNKKVDERLDKIEQDIKDIKACPTIARELKLIKQ